MTSAATTTAIRTFAIDKAHSEVTFQVRHLVTKVRGRFTDFTGTVQFDEARPELSSASFEAGTASIDTGTADRDQHLRSEDFFHVEKFPSLTFVSSKVTRTSAQDFGLMWNAALEAGGFLVGDEVKISASVQAVAQS